MLSVLVTAFVVPGLFATVALPAYAFTNPEPTDAKQAAAALEELREDSAQHVTVAIDAAPAAVARDAFTATSVEELARIEAEKRRAELAAQYAKYNGPSARDYLANAAYPNFSLDSVAGVALQYQGVPYRYGGADPSGFDCSGFVMFVYAQFGISLPHSSRAQGSMGTRIAPSEAVPGDVVVIDGASHVGIYLGNGNFIDAPYPGKVVYVHKIYSSNHYFVRYGI